MLGIIACDHEDPQAHTRHKTGLSLRAITAADLNQESKPAPRKQRHQQQAPRRDETDLCLKDAVVQ
jgi:hypothetical protein